MPLHNALFFACALALAACGKSTDSPPAAAAAVATSVAATAAPLDANDPCRLVSASEAEAVLGAPLAVPPYRSWGGVGERAGLPLADSDVCWFETAARRNLTVSLTRKGGGAVLAQVAHVVDKMERQTKARFQDGSELTGEWDEARVQGCCTLMALLGDTLVEVDTGGTEASPEQMGGLADAALKRLNDPLPYDSRPAQTLAEAHYARRPATGDPCGVLTASEVEAALGGKVLGPPEASGNECTWQVAGRKKQGAHVASKLPAGSLSAEEQKMLSGFLGAFDASAVIGEDAGGTHNETVIVTVTWRNGYRHFRTDNQMLGAIGAGQAAAIGGEDTAKLTDQRAVTSAGPWELAQASTAAFKSVKGDVQISLRPGTLPLEEATALLSAAYARVLQPATATTAKPSP